MPGLGEDLVQNHDCSGMPCQQMLKKHPYAELSETRTSGEWLTLSLRVFLIGHRGGKSVIWFA